MSSKIIERAERLAREIERLEAQGDHGVRHAQATAELRDAIETWKWDGSRSVLLFYTRTGRVTPDFREALATFLYPDNEATVKPKRKS